MLSIRMQRLGRKGYPTYRVVVQDSRKAPTSGKYVALLGSYNPHTKEASLVKDKAEFYLKNGAQPSDRVVALFKSQKITLPKWVSEATEKKRETRNPEKLRKNQPEKPAEEEPKAEDADKPTEAAKDGSEEQKPAETTEEKPDEEKSEKKSEAQEKTESKEEPKAEDKKPDSSDSK